MKQKIHFRKISIGETFLFAGKEYTKMSDRRAFSFNPRMESIFGTTDVVTIEVEEEPDFFRYPMYRIDWDNITTGINGSSKNMSGDDKCN